MLDEVVRFLKDKDVEFNEHASLGELSYIKTGGTARVIAAPDSIEKMVAILEYLNDNSIPFKIIGRMSNTMSQALEFPGVVVKTAKINRKFRAENNFTAECGVRLSHLIWDAAKSDLAGAEELFMIPGCVGGAVFNNASAHSRTVSDIFVRGDFYSLTDKNIVTLSKSEMQFDYRHSILAKRNLILLSAVFEFTPSDFFAVKNKIREYASIRRSTQPIEFPSLGSVYKRHDGVGAGYYIERAGLKGCRVGNAEISRKHAGFIINLGGASVSDVLKLIDLTKRTVYDKFGIWLEEEIEII